MTLFYINSDENSLVEEEYKLKGETKKEQVEELVAVLSNADHNVNYHATIPQEAPVEAIRVKEKQVELVFADGYKGLQKGREAQSVCFGYLTTLMRLCPFCL